ncbi:stress-activated map kinase interacting protein 1-domain-containing protein [Schizophyllum commune]
MSLISDTDYLIHRLRLSYLRDVEDPYGPRLITFDDAYQNNPYITASSLADEEQWPELLSPPSPPLSEDEDDRPSGFPGARRLKYTQTIMGGRTGGLGLRVNGKRASTSKRMSNIPKAADVRSILSNDDDDEKPPPVPEKPAQAAPPLNHATSSATMVEDAAAEDKGKASADAIDVQVHEATPPPEEEQPVNKVVQFIPKFKGAAEMERRRRLRMAARPRGVPPASNAPAKPLSFDTSSEEEDSSEEDDLGVPIMDESSSDEFDVVGDTASLDDGDEFDPDFAETRSPGITSDDSGSEALSTLTGSLSSSAALSPTTGRATGRLSPVHETHSSTTSSSPNRIGPYFEMLTPSPNTQRVNDAPYYPPRKLDRPATESGDDAEPAPPVETPRPDDGILTFTRSKVPPARPQRSALTAMLAHEDSSSNPFAELYAAISGRGQPGAMTIPVYFPHATKPRGKPLQLCIRRDATVEEVIGFALYTYWKEGWEPRIDAGLSGEDDERWHVRVSAVGWILRMAEEDGEPDDDFPAPDRNGRISKFMSDAYVVMEANPTQVQQNLAIEAKIQRRPSRVTANQQNTAKALAAPTSLSLPLGSAMAASSFGSLNLSTSLGPSSSHGPQIFLRIRVADTADAVHISTTIPVSAGMYMQEALELVCRKRKLDNPKDYALLLADMSILIPLDRTVASLQGKRELVLVKKSMLPQLGHDLIQVAGKTTDPNASIFKRMSDTPEMQLSSALDYTAAYKKYVIYRKMPMLVTRQERVLAIDGGYIHIMPSTNKPKAVFDSSRTASYHIKNIVEISQSHKMSNSFKLILNHAGGKKRYDFEAESAKQAADIVQTIRSLKTAIDRSSTLKSRRSRHVA